MTNYVITIGRQFGSGGHEIGKRIAKKLGIPFYDKELINVASQRLGYKTEYVQEKDETRSFFSSSGFYISSKLGSYYQMSPEDKVFIELTKIIKELAEQGPCVIVGRCADYILRDKDSINIYLFAPIKDRVERKLALGADEHRVSYEEMEKTVLDADKHRRKYYEYYTDSSWGYSPNYNLCIDTSKLGINGSVDLITSYLENFGKTNIMPDSINLE